MHCKQLIKAGSQKRPAAHPSVNCGPSERAGGWKDRPQRLDAGRSSVLETPALDCITVIQMLQLIWGQARERGEDDCLAPIALLLEVRNQAGPRPKTL